MRQLATALLTIAFCANASACRGPFSEDYVLLDALPDAAREQEVVAKVRVISRTDQAASVVVVEAIKGVVMNERIQLETSGSSCSWLDARTRFFMQGQAAAEATPHPGFHYIAGNWQPAPPQGGARTFVGAWRGQKRMH